ncbi:MAG: trypsin-like peptidase domain-containing protein [Muribaculaceae bacterium]|nr:trypsin-like peptidase domain-containing protein [Muribaculaceae bacterium]
MKRNFTVHSIILGLILLLSGCSKSIQDIIEETKSATVTIFTFDEYGAPSGEGSGFFISENGTCLTNYHVLDGATKAVLKTSEGLEFEIDSVLVSNKKKDIIKFNIKNPKNKKFAYLQFANTDIKQGDKVYNVSSPIGLEQTVSDGIISALRSDSHGEVVQVTAPISPGSSGSAIVDENGDVIALATFLHKGGQNLNFGVRMSDDVLAMIQDNEFIRKNPKFNKKEDFVIINVSATNATHVRLNAIEFKPDATIAYLSYSNLDMTRNPAQLSFQTEDKSKSYALIDMTNEKTYPLTSFSTAEHEDENLIVSLASTTPFRLVFPALRNNQELTEIEIKPQGNSIGWKFEGVNIADARSSLHYDMESYQKNYAYAMMREGELDYAQELFTQILEETPDDEDALNAMGILSYVQGNMKDALSYFNEAIENHPSSETSYNNRAKYYVDKGDLKKAKADLTRSISINESGENYLNRAEVNMGLQDVESARADLTKAIEKGGLIEDPYTYYKRACCAIYLHDYKQANEDIRMAYKLNRDPDFDKHLQELYNAIP